MAAAFPVELLGLLLLVTVAVLSDAQSRLRITNGCSREPLWLAHEAGNGVGPDPQNIYLAPMESHDFLTPDGLSGTRYWPKMRCNLQGSKCEIGESGGPEEVCHKMSGCAPPVDTKFEGSFGQNGEDWVDISLVDGFTLPFKFEMKGGNCTAGFGEKAPANVIDCSRLSFDRCPRSENLGIVGPGVDLRVVHPDTQQIVGCYSPCSKLIFDQWGNPDATHLPPSDSGISPFCCPTPPMTPEACRAGPIPNSSFVEAVHSMCPGVYGYSYDDGMGLLKCTSDTHYEVTFFCPLPSSPAAQVAPAGNHLADSPPTTATLPGAKTPAFLAYVRKFELHVSVLKGQPLAPVVGLVLTAAGALAAFAVFSVAVCFKARHYNQIQNDDVLVAST